MKMGGFVIALWKKTARNRQSKQMKIWKLAFWAVFQIKFKNFRNFAFAM